MQPPSPRTLSVVLVDRDERPVGAATIDAVVSSRSAALDIEVVVVDARTTGARAWRPLPAARVVGAAPSIDECEAWRRGLAAASGDCLAVLDALAVVAPGALEAAVARLEADPAVAAVTGASALLGEPTVSFAGAVGTFHPVDDRSAHDVLFAHPEVQVYRRSAFEAAGGFDEAVGGRTAAVDLGWRLRLAGGRVVLDPACAVDAPCACTPEPLAGLVTAFSCLGDEASAVVLPAATAIVGSLDPALVDAFVDTLPALDRRRRDIQQSRRVPDRSILDLAVGALEPPRTAWQDDDAAARYAATVARHGLHRVFRPRQRILVLTPDVFTEKLAGPAIRAWRIAEALAAHHVVHLATTSDLCTVSADRFDVSAPGDAGLRELAGWADIIVVQGFVLEGRPYLRDNDKVMVVDIYDPLHLEQLELYRDDTDAMRRLTLRGAVTVLNEQLARGDYFICASDKQRDLWLGHLSAVGRVNHLTYDEDERLDALLGIVPFGLPDEPPRHTARAMKGVVPGIGEDDEVILWGGGIYNWFDPLTLVRAVDRLRRRRPNVRLFFMGLQHPNPDVSEMRMATETRRLSRELGLTGTHVFFNEGWVRYEDRQNFLLEADVGVSTHLDHVETAFSFRTRILDYLWAALPIVATEGDAFAQMIASEGLGLTVPPGDVDALEAALFRMLDDAAFAESCSAALAARRGDFTWTAVLEPLVAFCLDPRRAPDRVDPDMVQHLWRRPDPDRAAEPVRPPVPVTVAATGYRVARKLARRVRTHN